MNAIIEKLFIIISIVTTNNYDNYVLKQVQVNSSIIIGHIYLQTPKNNSTKNGWFRCQNCLSVLLIKWWILFEKATHDAYFFTCTIEIRGRL